MPDAASRLDRAAGVLVGTACGDALGVPHEFATVPKGPLRMTGGGLGPYEPGEWSDDTQMALCVALSAARGELATGLDGVADRFLAWRADGASDIGIATNEVLRAAGDPGPGSAERLRRAAHDLHERTGRTAGNGALTRTAVVALVALDDRDATADLARRVAELTHADPLAGDSCVLWTEAVRRAVADAVLDVRGGLDLLPERSRARWSEWIDDAEADDPQVDLEGNGFTVTALQAAWRSVVRTSVTGDPEGHVRSAIEAAVRFGGDTDTVAAIAGGLVGALRGTAGVPETWRRDVHGWPGLRLATLERLGRTVAVGEVVASGDV